MQFDQGDISQSLLPNSVAVLSLLLGIVAFPCFEYAVLVVVLEAFKICHMIIADYTKV